MPVLGLETQYVNFYVLEDNDPKTISLLDKSVYFGDPEKPLVSVIPPGFTGCIDKTYTPNSVIILTSDDLQLTYSGTTGCTADIPDGVYQITLKFCPYTEFFQKRCHLKTSSFQRDLECFLLKIDSQCGCLDPRKIKEDIIDIEILLLSAKAEVNLCSVDKATAKYKAAVQILKNLNDKLNCQ
jgi:hypothetical protein